MLCYAIYYGCLGGVNEEPEEERRGEQSSSQQRARLVVSAVQREVWWREVKEAPAHAPAL